MKVQGTDKAISFRASLLVAFYDITIEQAKALKLCETIEVKADVGKKMIDNGIAVGLDAAASFDSDVVSSHTDDDKEVGDGDS